MPGLLKPSARCPKCGTRLMMLFDTSNVGGVTREYIHEAPNVGRRKVSCKAFFEDHAKARKERQALEGRIS